MSMISMLVHRQVPNMKQVKIKGVASHSSDGARKTVAEKSQGDRYDHLRKFNETRKDAAYENLQRIMRDLIMSTRDIAARLQINRDSANRYMVQLEKENKAERVGKTIHHGSSAKLDVWRLIEDF